MRNTVKFLITAYFFIALTSFSISAAAKSEYKNCHTISIEMPVRMVKNKVEKFLAKVNQYGKMGYKTFQIRFETYYWAAWMTKCEI